MQKEKNRSKRLQKKLYLGEFAVMGFEFTCKVNLEAELEFDAFFHGLGQLIEDKNLLVDGGGNKDNFEGYVTSGERYSSATEEDRKAVEGWLSSQPSISEIQVAELSDVYYGYSV